jgi:hypothetical protein
MVLTRKGSISRNIADSGPATDSQEITMSEIDMIVTYVIGTPQYYSLLLLDVYNVVRDVLDEGTIGSILMLLCLYRTEIVEGWTTTQAKALEGAIHYDLSPS